MRKKKLHKKKLCSGMFLLLAAFFMMSAKGAFAQFAVSGTVSDEDGALAGVSVSEKGTSNGTVTGSNGQFSLEVSDQSAVLIFSFVGYATEEVAVNGRNTVDVNLSVSSKKLSDVVVTALGIERSEKALGYSVGRVTGDDAERSNPVNPISGLAGKVPGVSIGRVADEGSSVNMVIRGASSLAGNNQPLFVVDGVPVESGFNNVGGFGSDIHVDYGDAISDISPEDIEDITILKGPSAAALYGSRAGSGVVQITTKKGRKAEGVGVSINSSTVFDIPYKFSTLMSSRFARGDRPYTPDENPFPGGILDITGADKSKWVGPELDQGYEAIQYNSPLDENGNRIPVPLRSWNNGKNFFQTGITSNNSVALSNASDEYNYRLSYGNMNNRGVVPNMNLVKNNLDFSAGYQMAKNFKVSTNIHYVDNKSGNRPSMDRSGNVFDDLAYFPPNLDITQFKDQIWEEGQEGLQQRSWNPDKSNPYWTTQQVINSFDRKRIYGNLEAEWQITKEISLRGRYGIDHFNESRETKIGKSYTKDKSGVYGIEKLTHYERNADLLATYRNGFGDFDFDASVGGNLMYRKNTNMQNHSTDGNGPSTPDLWTLSNIPLDGINYSSSWNQKAIYSLYGMASVGYKGMAYVDLTARNDWSSTLPSSNRSYFYPSASLSLLFDQMFEMPSSVSLIKLRAGWAQVGKDTGPYSLSPTVSNLSPWGSLPQQSMPGGILNAELLPEIKTSTEVGVDLALLDNRLRFSGTYYYSENKNQILGVSMPNSSGYTSKQINAGLVSSRGLELMLGITPTNPASPIQWDLNINWDRNRTKIDRLMEGMDFFTLWTEGKGGAWTYVGDEIGELWDQTLYTVTDENSPYFGYPILDNGGEWQSLGSGTNVARKIGNFNPRFTMGFQTSVAYKGFTLSASLDWHNGGDFISQSMRYAESDYHSDHLIETAIKPGVDHGVADADIPQFLKDNADKYIKNGVHYVGGPTKELGGLINTDGGMTTYDNGFVPGVREDVDANGNVVGYIENLGDPNTTVYRAYAHSYAWDFMEPAMFPASYLKLREISLTYAFPTQWINSIGLKHLALSVYSRDVILWTKAKIGFDPENAFQPSGSGFMQGIERYNFQPWKMPIGVKLSIKF